MTTNKTKRLVGLAILASLAWVISMFSFPILPNAPFLKIDFSDLPILFGMYVYGPLGGIVIAFIRSLLSYAYSGGEAGFPIGDTAAFIATISLTVPIYSVVRRKGLNLRKKLLAGLLGTLSLTVMLAFLNWIFIAPAYMAVMGLDVGPMRDYLLFLVVPFNLLKGPIVSAVFFVAFIKMKPWLDKTRRKIIGKKAQDLFYENS